MLATTKKNFDHIKAAYGVPAMFHTTAYRRNCADIELFKKLKVPFVHAAGDKIRLWTLNLATSEFPILNHQQSFRVPVAHKSSKDKLTYVVNMV